MFGSTTLDVVIGLTFIYLVLGLACAVIYETMASAVNLRAKDLERGIHALLKDPALVERFYDHPIIDALQIKKQRPAYIPSRSFALALLDIVAASVSNQYSGTASASSQYPGAALGGVSQYTGATSSISYNRFSDIRPALYSLPDDGATGELKRVLLIMVDEAEGSIDKLRNSIEIWFSSAMDRVSGMYKQRAMTVILILALLLTLAANIDTIGIAQHIWTTPILRDALAAEAQAQARRESAAAGAPDERSSQSSTPVTDLSTTPNHTATPSPAVTPSATPLPSRAITPNTEERLGLAGFIKEDFGLPIGWSTFSLKQLTPPGLFTRILGWFITALVVSLCATLCFDFLNKFILFRSTVKPHEQYIEQSLAARTSPETSRASDN